MLIAVSCAAVCMLVCLPLFMGYKKSHPRLAAGYKAVGTLCAMVPALIGAIKLDPACWVCVAALVFCAVADWTLEFRFDYGMGLFLLGHICYVSFFLNRYPLSATHVIIALLLILAMGFLVYKERKKLKGKEIFFAVYAAALSAMTACALSGGILSMSTAGWMTAIGGSLFFISDLILFRRILYPMPRAADWIIMITYYAGQLLIGASCLF